MFAETRKYKVIAKDANKRVDKLISELESDLSREYIKKLINSGAVSIGGKLAKASSKLKNGDLIKIDFPEPVKMEIKAIDIPLDIVFEDQHLIVINKPAGLVVHPGDGMAHHDDSLVNALLFHCKGQLGSIGGVIRPGIVHRLDKDTSGLLVVAKEDLSHQNLVEHFKKRQVIKKYIALVEGKLSQEVGIIEAPIGRNYRDRKKMAVKGIAAKNAITEYSLKQRYKNYDLLDINLKTGRTHQIRVHLSSIGHPLVGDQLYGVNSKLGLQRQFLHAYYLEFSHPITKKPLQFEVALPNDLQEILNVLEF